MGIIEKVNRYRTTYKNWLMILFLTQRKKYPIIGNMRNGKNIIIKNSFQGWLSSYGIYVKYDQENDIISFTFRERNYTFKGGGKNGDLADVFGTEEFKNTNFLGKEVLDIGANIGDSAVYFATNGANKVIAVEPFPKSFHYLKENIILNGVSDKVLCINAAVGGNNGVIHLDATIEDSTNVVAKETSNGVEIRTKTLSDIIKENNLKNAFLKIDCEGCEYEIFAGLDQNVLGIFDEIWIEYHGGLVITENIIINKLKKANFNLHVIKKDKNTGYLIGNKIRNQS